VSVVGGVNVLEELGRVGAVRRGVRGVCQTV
jgi:hypothetical protein